MSTVATLIETMARVMALDDDGDPVVDVSGVQSRGTETVEVLVRARECLRERSRSLTLRSPATCVASALELCGAADLPRDAAEAAQLTGPAGALGTWVPVAATARSGRASSGPAPGAGPAAERAGAGRAPPRDVEAAGVAPPAGVRRVGLGRRRGS